MRRIAVTLLLAVLLSSLAVVVAAPASACSCAGLPTVAASFASADAVFTGRLVSREVHHPDWPMQSSTDPALHVFAVDEVFKGLVHEQQGVVSADSGASCGLELSGEGPFVVYASHSDDGYTAGLCGGSGTLTPEIETELRTLVGTAGGGPEPPRAGASGADSAGLPTTAFAVAGAAILALALGGGVLLRRRHRSASTPWSRSPT